MANVTSLAAAVTWVTRWCAIQASENLLDNTGLEELIQRAGVLHNAAYSYTSSSWTLPVVEWTALHYLVSSLLSEFRAIKSAQSSSPVAAGQFSTSKSDVYSRNKELAANFMTQYSTVCDQLGLAVRYRPSPKVLVVDMVATDFATGATDPLELAEPPPAVIVKPLSAPVSGSLVLEIHPPKIVSNFVKRLLFHITGATEIHQPWNPGSIISPFVNDSAEVIATITAQRQTQFKLVDLSMTPGTIHRFLLGSVSKDDMWSFSNEVTATVP